MHIKLLMWLVRHIRVVWYWRDSISSISISTLVGICPPFCHVPFQHPVVVPSLVSMHTSHKQPRRRCTLYFQCQSCFNLWVAVYHNPHVNFFGWLENDYIDFESHAFNGFRRIKYETAPFPKQYWIGTLVSQAWLCLRILSSPELHFPWRVMQ